jgi:hypothetical protein
VEEVSAFVIATVRTEAIATGTRLKKTQVVSAFGSANLSAGFSTLVICKPTNWNNKIDWEVVASRARQTAQSTLTAGCGAGPSVVQHGENVGYGLSTGTASAVH